MHPKYRPDIDGLRAIAVFAVIGFHAFPSKLVGGFVGVVSGALASPGSQMSGGWEAAHVRPDSGQDDLGVATVDSGNRVKVLNLR